MATFEEALTALGKLDSGSELVDAVRGRVSKVNGEAAGLRTRLHKLCAVVGVESDAEDLDAQLEGFKKKISGLKTGGEFDELSKKIASLEKERDDERSEKRSLKVDQLLSEKLIGLKVHNEFIPIVKDAITKNIVFDDKGEPQYKKGVDSITIDDALKSVVSHRFIKTEQNPGSGGSPQSGGNAQKIMKRNDFDKLESRQRAEFMAAGGTLEV